MHVTRPAWLLPLCFAAGAANAHAQRVDTVRLAADPQVELLTIVHRPPGDGPHPVVLVRSPYRTRGGSTAWLAQRLVPRGYVVVEQDVRGTGGSSGTFAPFRFDVQDGRLTLDWIAQQRWAGPVGLWGISYLGWNAYALAEAGHPSIRAMALGSAWSDMQRFILPGGALHLNAHLAWIMGFAGGRGVPSQGDFDRIARALPLLPLFGPAQYVFSLAERPFRWEAVTVPALHFTGWHDYIYRDALHGFEQMRGRQGRGSQRLIVGAWSHNGEKTGETRVGGVEFGPAAAAGLDSVAEWTRRFFDVHLRGGTSHEVPVRVFFMGENRWRDFGDWPPPGASTRTWHLAAGGRLEQSAARRASVSAFRYDPNEPMPTLGGVNSHLFPANVGPLDQSPLDARADVARFITARLERPVVLAGPMRAVLHLEADAPATDVVVKLVVVAPDGSARVIEDGIRRVMRLSPGVNEVVVDLGQRAQRIERGSRLRLDVTGGNFPKYDRNPNSGEEPLTATALRPVNMKIHQGRTTPSRLEVTVVER